MDKNSILKADVLDIIFEGRNKDYGAYELRKTYNGRISKAIIFTVSLCILLVLISFAFGDKNKESLVIIEDVSLTNMKQEEKKPEPLPPPPPPKAEPPKVEITKFTPPKIVPDEEVKEDDKPPEMEKLEETKIGTVNQDGKKDDGVVEAPKEVSTGGTAAPVEDDFNKVYTTVEIEAEFPGGTEAWKRHLTRNLNAEAPKDEGAPAGRYTVIVSFIVDRAGNISDVDGKFQGNGSDYGTVAEAEKVIKNGPKWKPAVQNGLNVISRKSQPITFVISEE
jgi:periplasmic protein TonB